MVAKKKRIAAKPSAQQWVNDGGVDPEVQAPESLNVQTSKRSNSQESKSLNVQESEKLAKSKDPSYVRCTVYLKQELLDALPIPRRRTKGGKDMSDLINEAVAEWLSRRPDA